MARCLWQCTPRPDNPHQCQEGGEESEAVMTRPTRVTPTEIVCASPARLGLGARDRARARLGSGLANLTHTLLSSPKP